MFIISRGKLLDFSYLGVFMTMITMIYILNATIGFSFPMNGAYIGSIVIILGIISIFFLAAAKQRNENLILLDKDESGYKKDHI